MTGIKPSYWAYLRACIHLIDAGKPCTHLNLARELHISPQAVWKYLRRHPDVLAFVAAEMRAQNAHFLSPIVRRHSMLAQQGSVASADFVAKVEGGYYLRVARPGANGDEDESAEDARFVTHVNILVPCPQVPNGGRMPQLGAAPVPAPGMPNLKDIPTVVVR